MPLRATRPLLIPAFLFSAMAVHAQERAGDCFFSAAFEDGEIPAGWDIGTLVEVQDASGNGLDTFVVAWRVGQAAQANAGGFFPVPDVPLGNRFIMANDDAPPCNCDLGDVQLTTPPIDLTGRSGVALTCRAYHDQGFGGSSAVVEANIGGSNWIPMATVPAQAGDWQHLHVNLSAFDGQPALRLRFRWSDNGQWATGFAVDDICLRERSPNDLSVLHTWAHDVTADPFQTGDQTLAYSWLPLEQAGPMAVSAEVMNRGTAVLTNVTMAATIAQNGTAQGTWNATPLPQLLPGERAILVVATGWSPDAVGTVEVTVNAGSDVPDDDPTDNSGSALRRISGPGWADGYGAMAADAGIPQAEVGGTQAFIAANRMELIASGMVPTGVSAFLSGSSAAGRSVRAILFDGNLAFVDTSMRHVLTEEDIQRAGGGEALFLPFNAPPPLAAGDYFVGLQHLDGPGEGPVLVNASGIGPIGRALLMEGLNFDVTYLRATPMVRLHFADFGVGLAEQIAAEAPALEVFPVPLSGPGRVRFELATAARVQLQLLDMAGRPVAVLLDGQLPAGRHEADLDAGRLATGAYLLRLMAGDGQAFRRIVVAR